MTAPRSALRLDMNAAISVGRVVRRDSDPAPRGRASPDQLYPDRFSARIMRAWSRRHIPVVGSMGSELLYDTWFSQTPALTGNSTVVHSQA